MNSHLAEVPGGTLYYQTRGTGPALILSCGGPGNADTLAPLAESLQDTYTVITYDRRGYSRSHLEDPTGKASIARHSDDLHHLITHLGTGPAAVFGTSFGALIALDLAATAPAAIATLVVHEPPLGQVLPAAERQPFDLNLDADPTPPPRSTPSPHPSASSAGSRETVPPAGPEAGEAARLGPGRRTSSCSSAAMHPPSATTTST